MNTVKKYWWHWSLALLVICIIAYFAYFRKKWLIDAIMEKYGNPESEHYDALFEGTPDTLSAFSIEDLQSILKGITA